jgi:hypothetical protein
LLKRPVPGIVTGCNLAGPTGNFFCLEPDNA